MLCRHIALNARYCCVTFSGTFYSFVFWGTFFFWWLGYRCFNWTCPPHFRKPESLSSPVSPLLFLYFRITFWLNSKTFLCACQSLDETRLYAYVIWVAVKHEPAINYTAIWAVHLERIDCLGFISWAPHSLDGWRFLAEDRVRRECCLEH